MKNLFACVGYNCGEVKEYEPYSPNNNNNSHHHLEQQRGVNSNNNNNNNNTNNNNTSKTMQHRSVSRRRADSDNSVNNGQRLRSRSVERPNENNKTDNINNNDQHYLQFHQRSISDYLDAQEQDTMDEEDNILICTGGKVNNNNNNLNETCTEDETLSAYSSNESSYHEPTQQQEEQAQQDQPNHHHNGEILPTLLRYPVSESRNKNCWSESPVSIYTVRGGTYFTNKKKVASGPYLFQARGSDIFLFADDTNCTFHPSDLSKMSHSILGGQLRKKPTLAINFRFPWGYMNLYFEIPAHMTQYLTGDNNNNYQFRNEEKPCTPLIDPKLSPAEKTAAAWLLGNTEYKNERLKLIAYVAEGPWVVRNMVTGRPAIIGKKLPVSYELCTGTGTKGNTNNNNDAPLLTATLDIGSSSTTAKRIVSVCRRYMSALTVDIGFVIQGETPDELPEQMLGSVRVHGPDPLKAPKIGGQQQQKKK